ncbi:MAG: hypothetical protein JWM98_1003 [Thermoleophilia bacterium]|nr:hypothetical protein [Thermoleophilia bacterium]
MNSIPSNSAAVPALRSLAAPAAAPAASAAAPNTTAAPSGDGDALAAMRPAMDAANAIGRPVDAAGAAGVLATTGSYIRGATSTLAKLDDGIRRREDELPRLRATDPAAAAKSEEQLELLHRLRDRIQLSIERVSRTIAGSDDDVAAPGRSGDDLAARTRARKREDLELLEQRRRLLAPEIVAAPSAPATHAVATAYAAGAVAS